MNQMFSINAEGGPLLLVDLAAAKNWSGAERDDYETACALFDNSLGGEGVAVSLGEAEAILWEMAGPGVADFYEIPGGFRIVRAWTNDAAEIHKLAWHDLVNPVHLGALNVPSRELAVLWSTEASPDFRAGASDRFAAAKNTSIENSAFAVRTTATMFDCLHDEVAIGTSLARRLTLMRTDDLPRPSA